MIESMEALKRRELAVSIADEIIRHPAYPYAGEFPRAMIVIIDRALEEWRKRP